MVNLFNYIERPSLIHRMAGASKLLLLLLWTAAAMVTFNTPFLVVLTVLGLFLFPLSHIRLRDVKAMLILLLSFMVVNGLLIYLFSPEHGVSLYGTRHLIWKGLGRFTLTKEQLLYQLNVALKYTATTPLIVVFIASTDPSELAASLNRLGLPYTVSYSVALAMRYIPDTISEYRDVSKSQQARGIEMSKKENILKRIKAAALLVLPLILSSVERIDIITRAMELRKFGRAKKRTWIMARPFTVSDWVAMILGVLLLAYSIFFNIQNGSRYWNPFV